MLSVTHEDMAQQLGAASPQAQSTAFYLACALSEMGRNADAAVLASPLRAADLAAAEPREDWELRLEALRAEILIRQGHGKEGIALLRPAIAKMEAMHTPREDVEPLQRLLVGATGK